MKVYIKNTNPVYDYPEEMVKILDYLNAHGKLQVSGETVERLYRDFSDDIYCAGWMGVNDQCLGEFADWLAKIDL